MARASRPTTRPAPAILALSAALLLVACADLRGRLSGLPGVPGRGPAYSQEELRADLASYVGHFMASVGGTADRIAAESPERNVRKRALLWKVRITPLVREAALRSNPQEAFAETLAVAVAMERYLTEGDGSEAFGAHQPAAVRTARELLAEIRAIGVRFLSESQLARAERAVARHAAANAIRGPDFAIGGLHRSLAEVESQAGLDWLLELPLAPVRALEGVGSGAAAIHDFNRTAQSFSAVVASLPLELRWELELLLFSLEEREATQRTLDALDGVAEGARSASGAVERLPEDLRSVLVDARGTLAELDTSLRRAESVAPELERTAAALRGASASWERILARPAEEASEGREEGRPFDIREWESAAAEIRRSARELRGLAEELRALDAAQGGGGLAASAERLRGSAARVVDHAAWRVFQLLVVLFLLLFAYRLLSALLRRRAEGAPGSRSRASE